MKVKEFKALYPALKLIASPDSFFGSQKKQFPHYVRGGFFKRTNKKFFYVYEIIQDGKSRLGLVATTDIEDILENHILKHENTLAEKEQQMMHLVMQRNAMIKPVLLAHKKNKELNTLYKEVRKQGKVFMDIYFENEKAHHKIYKVLDEDLTQKISRAFLDIPQVYIADGHHRVSTGLLLYKNKNANNSRYSELLSIYFGFDQLRIYDYNRTVSILKEISATQLMARLSQYFTIHSLEKPQKPKNKHEICFMIQEEAYLLKWKKPFLAKPKKSPVLLDAELLDKFIFGEIMHIKDVRHDSRLSYTSGVEGISGIEKILLKDDYAVGFMLYPVAAEELMKVAEAGLTLPPKSTWFEPRVKNAVISQEF